MLIAGYAQEVSSRREDRQNKMHVDRSLTRCSEENPKVLGFIFFFFLSLFAQTTVYNVTLLHST